MPILRYFQRFRNIVFSGLNVAKMVHAIISNQYILFISPPNSHSKNAKAPGISPGLSSAYHKKEVTAPTPKNGHNKRARPLSASLLCDPTILNDLRLRFRYYYSILCCVLPVSNMRTFVTRIYVFQGCIDVSVSEYLRDLLDFHSSV